MENMYAYIHAYTYVTRKRRAHLKKVWEIGYKNWAVGGGHPANLITWFIVVSLGT